MSRARYTKQNPCTTRPPTKADSSCELVWGYTSRYPNGEPDWFQPYWFTVSKSFENGRGITWAHHDDWVDVSAEKEADALVKHDRTREDAREFLLALRRPLKGKGAS